MNKLKIYSIVIGVLLIALAIITYKLVKTQEYLNYSQLENKNLHDEIVYQKDINKVLQKENLMLKNSDITVTYLKWINKESNSLARIYHNKRTKENLLRTELLPVPPVDNQYIVWGINLKDTVCLGGFSIGLFGFQRLNKSNEYKSYIITLEKRGQKEHWNRKIIQLK